jgi:hypothetical protein
MRIAIALVVATLAAIESGCCRWCQRPCPEVAPRPCWVCTDSPDVAAARTCVAGCTTPECRSGCCHRFALIEGTDEERTTLRSCVRECAAP